MMCSGKKGAGGPLPPPPPPPADVFSPAPDFDGMCFIYLYNHAHFIVYLYILL